MRKWILAGFAALAVCVGGVSYHLFVTRRSAEHLKGLIEAPKAAEKALHYREVFRYYDPLDGSRPRARQWVAENGHEWGITTDGQIEESEAPEIIIFYGKQQAGVKPSPVDRNAPQYPTAQPSLRQSEPAK